MTLWGKSNSQVAKTSKSSARGKMPSIVDGDHIDDLWQYLIDMIDAGLKARDLMTRPNVTGGSAPYGQYELHVARNYRYFSFLRAALAHDGINVGSGNLSTNDLLQSIRNKYAMVMENAANWRWASGKPENVGFTHNLNYIKNVELGRQGFYLARAEAIMQMCVFGASAVGFHHTISTNEPYGDDYFHCTDPLAFLFEFGSRHINGIDPASSRMFIVVNYRSVKAMEREYGVKIDDGASLIEHRKFSIWHGMSGLGMSTGSDADDFMCGRAEEVTVYFRDESTVPVYEDVPRMLPVIDFRTQTQTGETQDVDPETGEPQFDKVKTNRRRMRYRDYRKIVFSRNTMLFDDNLPDNHGLIPYLIYKNVESGISPYGLSDVDNHRDEQITLASIQNTINDSVLNAPGVVLMNEKYVQNPHKPFERDENGLLIMKIDNLSRNATLDNVIAYKQPSAMSQDAYNHYQTSKQNMRDGIGSQQETFGVSAAADSGIKNEGQNARVLRYHSPIARQEARNMEQLAVMWLSNLIQYQSRKKSYAIVGPDGIASMETLWNTMDELQDVCYLGVEVVPQKNIYSTSDDDFRELLELKSILGIDLNSNDVLRASRFPNLVQSAMKRDEQREKVIKLIQSLEQSGQLDQLLSTISTTKGPPSKVA